ncbi:hypothetical protein MTF65_22235 [Streptomyces sp. APSN-46.1]|uniref:hypothetical protein n=1 Tax=Streptomyces sp. APSN-46.1 TaxID=2929049 RepID=UPI001FB32379|nr:hypothetical protein [Streptomyces sp. APSN-46.1]MCJ1680013.1 hypothetical protein [Streptomyces sp. APSN-46.1]
MAEAVPVRCPACLRENDYTAPVFPCACGSPVTPPLDLTAPPLPLTHRNWSETWVAVRCTACGRESEWPHPEVGCGSCGTVVRIPVHPVEGAEPAPGARADAGAGGPRPDAAGPTKPRETPGAGAAPGTGAGTGAAAERGRAPDSDKSQRRPKPSAVNPAGSPLPPTAPVPRPAFRPVTIRTARDAVATAALYLRWLGFRDVRQPDGRPIPSAAVDLRAPGLVAQVDPTTAPAGVRAVECVWLNGLTASATSVYFALAGYTEDARTRADDLGIPLFVMDLTGMPQPVNNPADELIGTGA